MRKSSVRGVVGKQKQFGKEHMVVFAKNLFKFWDYEEYGK